MFESKYYASAVDKALSQACGREGQGKEEIRIDGQWKGGNGKSRSKHVPHLEVSSSCKGPLFAGEL